MLRLPLGTQDGCSSLVAVSRSSSFVFDDHLMDSGVAAGMQGALSRFEPGGDRGRVRALLLALRPGMIESIFGAENRGRRSR